MTVEGDANIFSVFKIFHSCRPAMPRARWEAVERCVHARMLYYSKRLRLR